MPGAYWRYGTFIVTIRWNNGKWCNTVNEMLFVMHLKSSEGLLRQYLFHNRCVKCETELSTAALVPTTVRAIQLKPATRWVECKQNQVVQFQYGEADWQCINDIAPMISFENVTTDPQNKLLLSLWKIALYSVGCDVWSGNLDVKAKL